MSSKKSNVTAELLAPRPLSELDLGSAPSSGIEILPMQLLRGPFDVAFEKDSKQRQRKGALSLVRFPGPRKRALWHVMKVANSLSMLPSDNLPSSWPLQQLSELWIRLLATNGPHQGAPYRTLVFPVFDHTPLRANALFGNDAGVLAVAKFSFDVSNTRKLEAEVAANTAKIYLSDGFARPELLHALIGLPAAPSCGVALWEGVTNIEPPTRKLTTTKVPIQVDPAEYENFEPWETEVIELIAALVPADRLSRSQIAEMVRDCERRPVHGDVTNGNLLRSGSTSWLIDWENFHPLGPALTDTVTQLLDFAQAKPGAREKNAFSLVRQYPIEATLPALGFIANSGNALASAVLKRLV